MASNFRCDYCGATYEVLTELCKSCGQYRIYNLIENKPTALYNHVGWETREPISVADKSPGKGKPYRAGVPGKESKDLKAKRTSPVHVDGRQNSRR